MRSCGRSTSQPSAPGAREEVYCTKVGTTHPEEMYIVGAHMDGIGWGEAANDDGSGAALVMELARVFSSPGCEDRALHPLRAVEQRGDRPQRRLRLCRAARGAAGDRVAGRVRPYPEPRWLGMIQHDMDAVRSRHAARGRHGRQGSAAGGRREHRVPVAWPKQAEGAQKLAWAFYAANEAYATDYPAAVGPHMTNTD